MVLYPNGPWCLPPPRRLASRRHRLGRHLDQARDLIRMRLRHEPAILLYAPLHLVIWGDPVAVPVHRTVAAADGTGRVGDVAAGLPYIVRW
jgi:hypothetical protein